jgi:hypothetical protein
MGGSEGSGDEEGQSKMFEIAFFLKTDESDRPH